MVYHRHEDNFQLLTSITQNLNLIKSNRQPQVWLFINLVFRQQHKNEAKQEQNQLSTFRSYDHFHLPVLLVYIRYAP